MAGRCRPPHSVALSANAVQPSVDTLNRGKIAALSEVRDKGKPGESRRRQATRLRRVQSRFASRAAEPLFPRSRAMRKVIMALAGLTGIIVACKSEIELMP